MKTAKLIFQLFIALAMTLCLYFMFNEPETVLISASLFLLYSAMYVLTIPAQSQADKAQANKPLNRIY